METLQVLTEFPNLRYIMSLRANVIIPSYLPHSLYLSFSTVSISRLPQGRGRRWQEVDRERKGARMRQKMT